MKTKTVSSSAQIPNLVPWLEQMVCRQLAAAKVVAEEEARRRALPLPRTADVLAALRAGKRLIVYAGRAGKTYFMDGDSIRCDMYEESEGWVEDSSEEELAKDIERYPDSFREL